MRRQFASFGHIIHYLDVQYAHNESDKAMDDFYIREATLDDKEAVLGIDDNVYEGSDYLPVYYEHFIGAPNITPFVLMQKENIIGFTAAHILDAGQTVATRAVRLHPDFVGKGLYGYFDKYILQWAKSQHVVTKAFTTTDRNPNIGKSSFLSVNKLILSKKFLLYTLATEKVSTPYGSDGGLTAVSGSLLESYLTTNDLKSYLFPEGRFILDYVPFKLIDKNFPFVTGPEEFRTMLSDVHFDGSRCAGLLSCVTLFPCKELLFHCTVEIYGNDAFSVNKHVSEIIRLIRQKVVDTERSGTVRIGLYLEKQVSLEFIDQAFMKHGVPRTIGRDPNTSKERYTEFLLFEKAL